jgi:ABC-type multidrug transport system ATPase subunit
MNAQQSLEADADAVMEQLIMQESRHMQMGALVEHQLHYPDMTIRDFFEMVARELHEQEEELGYYD